MDTFKNAPVCAVKEYSIATNHRNSTAPIPLTASDRDLQLVNNGFEEIAYSGPFCSTISTTEMFRYVYSQRV
jgi:hypothetical protein